MNFIFRLDGGAELKASGGHVPETFYVAVRQVVPRDFVEAYEGGFVHSVERHERLYEAGAFRSYVVVRYVLPAGAVYDEAFLPEVVERLRQMNFARPLVSHQHYQVFFMEYFDASFDDD